VLRFWAVWDERDSLYGDRRPYAVHYYLADDMMEARSWTLSMPVHAVLC
jgi:EF-hand domain-containing protein 1